MSEMQDNPESVWKRPWAGKWKTLAWFLLLSAAIFIPVCFVVVGMGSNSRPGPSEYLPLSILVALVLAAAGMAIVAFIKWVASWRNFRRFLFWAACFITLIALLILEENVRGKHAWLKHRHSLEAAGEKLDLADLLPPPVADESNFAVMPVFKPLYEFTQGTEGIIWRDTNGIARLNAISATLPVHGDHRTGMGSLEKGTFADMDQCQDFYKGNTNYPQAAAGATPADTVLTALGKFEPEIQQLREAAAARPHSRFPIQYGHQPSWEILLPHLSHLKGLTTLMCIRATAELEAGKGHAARDDLNLAMRFSDSVSNEPILIDHLVRLATLGIDLQALREGLAQHAWSDAELQEFETHLRGINLLAEYKFCMRGERALCIEGLDYLRRNGMNAKSLGYMDDDGRARSAGGFGFMASGFFYQNMLTISRMHDEYTLNAVNQKEHRVHPEFCDHFVAAVEKLPRTPYTLFARMLLPAVEKAVPKSARMQFYLDAARVGCAIERYRLANGRLPQTLQELSPAYLTSLPNDLMDGRPLKYKPDDKSGYILYSVGWNGTDDGGQLALKNKKDGEVDTANGDWVWIMK